MINIHEINDEITKLENGDTSWASLQKLTWLYSVRDHLTEDTSGSRSVFNVTEGSTPTVISNSEFLTACSGVDIAELLQILNEHMEAVKIVHNREYNAVIRKIKSLPSTSESV